MGEIAQAPREDRGADQQRAADGLSAQDVPDASETSSRLPTADQPRAG